VTGLPYLRFAVGSFGSWLQLQNALDDLRLRGMVHDDVTCLALARLFAGETGTRPPLIPCELPFPLSPEPICCTAGPLCECLRERLDGGARSLKDALGRWIIPRHAAHFQAKVEQGNILLWVQLEDGHDERRAYQSLLAHSSNSVGVHDIVA
jgi:hypothetical protein